MAILSQLTGKEFYWSILSGGKKIIEHQEEINKINVFPVPDGDTGSNMAATATSIIYNSIENPSIELVATSIGDAALDGARGNSGVIFAQFLYSIGQEMAGVATLSTQKFAEIIKKSSEYVYEAIPSPQEGTIISVIREWAEYLDSQKNEYTDFGTLLEKAEEVAQQALAKTSEQLEALRLAKVVDAGAKGFVLFIEGIKETILKRAFSREDHDMTDLLMASTDLLMAEAEELTEESLHNRYCTETCLIGENIDKKAILKILETDSDSIVTAGSEKKLRLHFHTNNPASMFDKLRHFGTFTFQKIEDMRRQYTTTHQRKHKIAVVVDSGIALTPEYMDENQLHVIPFSVDVEGTVFYDFCSLDLELFTQRMEENPNMYVKSAQPSPKAFADMFGYLSKYYESIIVLTVSSDVSGTYNSALQGVDLIKKRNEIKIDVIDSRHLSAGAGAVAHNIIDDINSGLDHDQIVLRSKQHAQNVNNFINFRTIDHMIRSGRLGVFKGRIIKTLRLCPILEMPDGKPIIAGKAIGWKKALKKTIATIKESMKTKTIKYYVVSHSMTDTSELTPYLDALKQQIGFEAISVNVAPPSIATNVGLGAVNVGVMYE